MNLEQLLSRSEIRRLEKAAREKNKQHLVDWIKNFTQEMDKEYRVEFEKAYQDEIQNTVDNIITSVAFTVCFSEDLNNRAQDVKGFMDDLYATIDMFRTGEYKPEDYAEKLKELGVNINVYDYSRLYKESLNKLNNLITEYTNKLNELNSTSKIV